MGYRCAPTATTGSRVAISASAPTTPLRPVAPVRPNTPAPATSARIVASHGNTITVEDCSITTWARLWGKRIALFSPGMLVAALKRECQATGGTLSRAGTRSTALSQHCLCGARVPKTLAQRTHDCPHCGLHADRD
ncbi:zinc ribbon domain-containing protein, partial [Mycobacterium sp.]